MPGRPSTSLIQFGGSPQGPRAPVSGLYGNSPYLSSSGTTQRNRVQYDEQGRPIDERSQVTNTEPLITSPYSIASQAPGVSQGAYDQQALLAQRNSYEQAAQESARAEAARQEAARNALTQQDIGSDRDFASKEGDKNRQTSTSNAQLQASTAKSLQAQQAAAELAFLAQQGTQQSDFLNQRASLSDSTWDKRFGQVQGAIGQVGQNSVQHGSAGMQGNEAAARAAAFARAKEQAGRTANSALASLKGMFENSGTMGSTMEAAQAGQILGGAGAGVNQFTRDQMISDLSRAAEIEDTQYSGNIAQRAQDNQMKQALLALMNGGALY